MRELYETKYNSDRFTDINVLYDNELIDVPTLDRTITYLYGKDSEMFPLSFLSQTEDGVKPVKKLNDTQYTWAVLGRMKNTSKVVGLVGSIVKAGLNNSTFEVEFEDSWLLKYYGIVSPDKQYRCRIQAYLGEKGPKRHRYRVQLYGGTSTEYITLDNLQPGMSWVMSAPIIAESKSDGTSSNSMSPGKWTNQFSYHRFSKPIAGNMGERVVNLELPTDNGGTSEFWMPFEMKQFEIHRRQMLEEELWNSKYNRNSLGEITLKDEETGEPIPTGAGIKEILKTTGQYDTYGTLTVRKFDTILTQLFTNRVDSQNPMELVWFTGAGGLRAFNDAIKDEIQNNNYYEKLGMEEVMSGTGGYLTYGKYFSQYRTIDGHIVTLKRTKLFDQGTYAEMDRANGRIYNGLPYESYNMILLDMSKNDNGNRNIQLVADAGEDMSISVYKGPRKLPGAWGAIGADKLKIASTKKDEASYEVIQSQGITLRNYTTSYFLEFSN